MRDVKMSIRRYIIDTMQYFFVILPVLLLLYYLDDVLFVSGGLKDMNWLNLIVWLWLMKEVAYWAYIREMTGIQWVIKRCIKHHLFKQVERAGLNVQNVIMGIRLVTKLASWSFIFVLAHTWLHFTGNETNYVFILLSSIIFYVGIEMRIMFKMAYMNYALKTNEIKEPS